MLVYFKLKKQLISQVIKYKELTLFELYPYKKGQLYC